MFHHNMDPGKFGLLVEVDTRTDLESIIMEVDLNGDVFKQWNMASIIASAMRAGGDDPSGFVRRGEDWFHSNAATYRASDNSLIISSRENFVIALDWIVREPSSGYSAIRPRPGINTRACVPTH